MKKSIFISLFFVLMFVVLDKIFFVTESQLFFYFSACIPGATIVLFQKKNRSWGFLPSLVAGSLIYSSLSAVITRTIFYFTLVRNEKGMSSGILDMLPDTLIIALPFFVASFMGGLLVIVIKGFYILRKNKNQY